jgi:hypothetical protein
METRMSQLFKITHRVDGALRAVAVEARDADAAQELFIDQCEAAGIAHGTIVAIRAVAGA